MITLIHGNDTLTSRNFFLDQKDEESLTFDAESISLDELALSLQGPTLLFTPDSHKGRTLFIENSFTRKSAKNLESIGKLLSNYPNANVYFWADKEIGVKALVSFPKIENKNFKIPQNIWAFLDGIRPLNPSNITSFHKTLNETEPEIIFAMLVRQFRLMLGLVQNSRENIDEVKRIAPWQKSKLIKQASLFGEEKLKTIYKKLYKIDKSTKTGKTNLTLTQNIDILLLEI